MKITVLVDNGAAPGLVAQRGLSLLIEDAHGAILFDTGQDDRFLRNAAALGVDPTRVSHLVLSHGHYDHSGGLPAFSQRLRRDGRPAPTLVAHPDAFVRRGLHLRLPGAVLRLRKLGAPWSREQAEACFPCRLQREPYWLNEDWVFLGEIPPAATPGRHGFGSVLADGHVRRDPIRDDSALVGLTPNGLVIVAGCSHSGVIDIIDHARAVTGESRVHAIVGGLHLRSARAARVDAVAAALRERGVTRVHACHCTGRAAARLPGQCAIHSGSQIEL